MKNLNQIDLLTAVIEFTKNPDKHSQYLNELRVEAGKYEEALAKYKEFENAQAFIDSEKLKLDDLRSLLEETRDALAAAWKDIDAGRDKLSREKNQQDANIREQNEQMSKERTALQKEQQLQQEVKNKNEDITRQLAHWQATLSQRESQFNRKWSLLQAIMNENN